MMANIFRKTLTLDDFQEKNMNLVSGVYTTAYEYRVGAQQLMTWGNGHITGGVDDRGKLTLQLKDNSSTPVDIKGWVRLTITDANEIHEVVVFDERTENLTDYRLAEYMAKARQDSKLRIQINPDADATLSTANSTGILPTTIIY